MSNPSIPTSIHPPTVLFSPVKSFGDSKIIPSIATEELHKVLIASSAYASHKALVDDLWEKVRELLFSTSPVKELGT